MPELTTLCDGQLVGARLHPSGRIRGCENDLQDEDAAARDLCWPRSASDRRRGSS